MKKIYKVSSSVLITIGLIHIIFGIISAADFDSEILWFIPTGLLLVVIGCVNLIMSTREVSGFNLRGIQVFNLLGTSFIVLLVIADPMGAGFLALLAQIFNSFGSWNVIRKSTNCCGKYSNI